MKIKEIITKALSLGTGLAIGILLIANISYELSHDRCYTAVSYTHLDVYKRQDKR